MIEDFVELVEAYEIIEGYAQFFGMVTGRTYSLEEEWDAAGYSNLSPLKESEWLCLQWRQDRCRVEECG